MNRNKLKLFNSLMLLGFTTTVVFADPAPVVVGHLAGAEATAPSQQTLVTATDSTSTTADSSSTQPFAEQQYQTASSGLAQEAAIPVQDNTQTQASSPSQSSLSLLEQVQTMQQQMRELQGQLEVQAHQLQVLKHMQAQTSNELSNKITALANGDKQAALQPLSGSVSQSASLAQSETPNGLRTNTQQNSQTAQAMNTQEAKAVLAEEQSYQSAYSLLTQKQYAKAQAGMQAYLQQYPKGKFAANAHYWLGELALISGNTTTALSQFKLVTDQFGSSQKVADSMLKMGLIYYNEQQVTQAENQLKALINKFPNSSSAQMAKQKLQLIQSSGNS